MVLVEHVDSHASSLDTGQDAVSAAGGDFVAAVQGNRVNRVLAFVLQVLASVEAADITCVIVDGTDTGDELAFVRKRRGVHQEHRNVLFVAGKECLGQSVAVPARQNQSVNALVDEVQAVVQLRGSIGRSVGGDAGPTLFLTCGLESVAHRDIERILERVHRKADGRSSVVSGVSVSAAGSSLVAVSSVFAVSVDSVVVSSLGVSVVLDAHATKPTSMTAVSNSAMIFFMKSQSPFIFFIAGDSGYKPRRVCRANGSTVVVHPLYDVRL